MAMPSGDSPQKAQRVLRLPAGPPPDRRPRSRPGTSTGLARVDVGLRDRRSSSCSSAGSGSTARRGSGRASIRWTAWRLHDRARRPGDAVLPPAHRGRRRLRGRADRRPHRLGAEVLMAAAAPVRLVLLDDRGDRVPRERLADAVRLAAGAQGPRPGVPGLPALRRLRPRRGTTATCGSIATRRGTRRSSSRCSSSAATPSSGCSRDVGRASGGAEPGRWRRSSDGATRRERRARAAARRLSRRRRGRPPLAAPRSTRAWVILAILIVPLPRLDAARLLRRARPALGRRRVPPAPLLARVPDVRRVLRGRRRGRSACSCPDAAPPVRTEPYSDDELDAHDAQARRSTSSPAARSSCSGAAHGR